MNILGNTGGQMKAFRLLGLSAVLMLLLVPSPAAAQCVMCGQTAANASEDPEVASSTFETAILVLLIPALALLTAAGILLWKFRDDPGGSFDATAVAAIRPAKAPLPPTVTALRQRKRSP